ncbi:MAG: methyltransferase domain-containing protein [Burkholderiales bacterium]
MSDDLSFTGERFLPAVTGEIAHEHWHRYAFARRWVAGRRVLDVACGEGYGSALLASVAQHVTGVDISPEAVAHARSAYGARGNVTFEVASANALPLADATVDAVVSFETLEHLPRADQPAMLAEIARVLAPGGVLVISAPNPVEYSQARDYRNPFHFHEPPRAELDALLAASFPVRRWYLQRRYFGSALWAEDADGDGVETLCGDADAVREAVPPPAMYHVVIAARTADALPDAGVRLSLFTDAGETELRRLDAQAAEVLRLDSLLRERDAALDRQGAHVRHLEALVAYRDGIIVERDTQAAAQAAAREEALAARDAAEAARDAAQAERNAAHAEATAALRARDDARARSVALEADASALRAEIGRLERALNAQERIIAYRQSARWWLALPWLRLRLLWQHLTGR